MFSFREILINLEIVTVYFVYLMEMTGRPIAVFSA
jgi:hypothetical protein